MPFKYASLTPDVLHILEKKGTEPPFSGKFVEASGSDKGTFICRGCGKALFREFAQFTSQCGWPSFDDQLFDNVKHHLDADGRRQEILCNNCEGHLGHVFTGEGYTELNTRHCVNSLAIEFVQNDIVLTTEEIILAAGCFWGVQHLLEQETGVIKTEVGYMGGDKINPTYEDVCTKTSGHLEVVRVLFDPAVLPLESLLEIFFEVHDFTQTDGQGPDLGPQYLSAIFAYNDEQKDIAKQVIAKLTNKDYSVATEIKDVSTFWSAEDYHQAYYAQNGKQPYCHTRRSIF